jgi:hypothetical protein
MRDKAMTQRERSQFAVALQGVELHRQPHPAATEALGAAEGNHVFLDLRDDFLGSPRSMELLGHELTHVLQQRQGRVRCVAGVGRNTDPRLEAEAELLGRDFDRLQRSLRDSPRTLSQPPVVQCFVQSAGRLIHHQYDLTVKPRLIFELINFSHQWLRAVNASGQAYAFANEFELLRGVQEGLHGTRVLLLRRLGLVVSPMVLEMLDLEELEAIHDYERTGHQNKIAYKKARNAIAKLSFRTEADLVLVEEFLTSIKMTDEPIFKSTRLADRIALFDLVDGAVGAVQFDLSNQNAAAKFAVNFAQSIPEFVDYYQFYMAYLDSNLRQATGRSRSPEAALEMLVEPLLPYLCCPNFPTPPRAQDLPALIAQWSSQGYTLGFPRISAAVAHMAMHARLHEEGGRALSEMVHRYMDRLQVVWLERVPDFVRYTQDGNEVEYGYRQQHGHIPLRLSSDGNLTVGPHQPTHHHLLAQTPATDAPSAGRS